MFLVEIQEQFNAVHAIKLPGGAWETPHNHQWRIRLFLSRKKLNKYHMVVDFHLAHKALKSVLVKLDDQNLNSLRALGKNPTTELVARYIFDQMSALLTETDVRVHSIALCEADNCWAWYTTNPDSTFCFPS